MTAVSQPVLANTFQAGTPGAAVPAGNAIAASLGTADGALFDTVSTSGSSTLTYSSAFAYSGTQSCQVFTPSTSPCYLMWTGGNMIANGAAQTWFRLYLYQAANPASLHQLFQAGAGGTRAADLIINTSGTLSMRDTSGNVIITTTTTVPLNAWYRVEGYVTSNASTGQMEMKLFTSPGSTTPAETQTSSAAQDTAGGNLSQMRFGPSSAGVTGLTYYMDDVAMSTSGYVGPGPVVFHMACGAPSDAGFQVTSKPVGGTSLRLKVATNPGLTSNVTYVAAQAPGTYGYVSHTATGLAAGTLYYAQLADTPPGGTEALAGPVCQVMTLPVPGTPSSFTVAFASCINSADDQPSPTAALTDWIGWAPDLAVFTRRLRLLRPRPDHCAGPARRRRGPVHVLDRRPHYPAGMGLLLPLRPRLHHRRRRLRQHVDRREHRRLPGSIPVRVAAARPELTRARPVPVVGDRPGPVHHARHPQHRPLPGREHRQLQQDDARREPARLAAAATGHARAAEDHHHRHVVDRRPPPPRTPAARAWRYYQTERASIIAYIAANSSLVKNVLLWHGDAHGVACCPGWGNPDGGFPVYCAAPLRQTGLAFAPVAPTFPAYYDNAGGECRQYGRVTVTDTGQAISVNFQGWDALNTVAQVTQNDTFNVAYGYRPRAGLL